MTEPIILETPRLVLREFAAQDGDDLARVICDPETMRYYPRRCTREQADEWIARNRERYATDGHGLWAVKLKATGEFIGDCGVIKQHVEGVDELEVGYHLLRTSGATAMLQKQLAPAATGFSAMPKRLAQFR